jgi:galactan 5-O-arabinofuranosyltransferase
LGVATLLGWILDLVRRDRPALTSRRALLVGGVGLLVAAPYWVTMLVHRVGAASDSLQLRWSPRGFDMPPLPLPTGAGDVVVLVAVVWLLARALRDRLAAGLAVALVAAYLTILGGQWLQSWDIGVLPHKSEPLVLAVSAAALVLALRDVATLAPRRRAATVLVATTASALVGVGLWTFSQHWLVGRPALVAQQMRYPDGGVPSGWGAVPSEAERAWGTEEDTPPATRLLETWRSLSGRGPELDDRTVVVSVNVELLATTPLHSFTPWKSIYSHPLGQYERRVALLEDVAGCESSSCAAAVLRDNPFDRVRGVIARVEGDEVVLPMGLDHFPEGWSYHEVRWPIELLQGPGFRSAVVGDTVVAVVE